MSEPKEDPIRLEELVALVDYYIHLMWKKIRFLFYILVLAYLASYFLPFNRNDTDPAWPDHSGLKLYTDRLTGCQYLGTGGSLTPRLSNGKTQLGCNQ